MIIRIIMSAIISYAFSFFLRHPYVYVNVMDACFWRIHVYYMLCWTIECDDYFHLEMIIIYDDGYVEKKCHNNNDNIHGGRSCWTIDVQFAVIFT